MGVGDANPGADREQLLRLGDARHADMDREPETLRPPRGDPRRDRPGVEAELGRHVARERRLGVEGFEDRPVGDERVALRIRGDADLAERVADLGHLAQQRQAVRVGARLLRVTTDDEGPIDTGALEPGDEIDEVGPIPDHPRRQVRDRPKAGRLELLAEGHGRLDPLGRRGGDRNRRTGRQERRLGHRGLERDQLEGRGREEAGKRLTRGWRQ